MDDLLVAEVLLVEDGVELGGEAVIAMVFGVAHVIPLY